MGYLIPVESDVRIFVEDINPKGKKTIVFIHGWPLNHKQFEYQYNVLPAMRYRRVQIRTHYLVGESPIGGIDSTPVA